MLDAEGRLHDPPRWEPVADHCPMCAAIADLEKHLPDDHFQQGITVYAAPYNPNADPMGSLADRTGYTVEVDVAAELEAAGYRPDPETPHVDAEGPE